VREKKPGKARKNRVCTHAGAAKAATAAAARSQARGLLTSL